MYGFGFLIFYYPIISMVMEFWIARRGMACGLLCSASGVSGVAFPFGLEAMLHRYGYPTTLRTVAIGLFVLTGPLIPLLKGRLPASEHAVVGKTDWSFLRTPLFWTYTASNVAQGLGYFFPSLYLPSYATAIGLTPTQGALLLAIMSISQVLGQLTFGYLSDGGLPLNLLTLASTLVSAVAVLALWGLAHTFPLLVIFALVYGFFGAGYVAMWARMGTAVTSEPTAAFATFGLFCFGKGVGNVLAGPISGTLITGMVQLGSYGASRYEAVVVFTGACMLVSAGCIGLWQVKGVW